ncbi:MAG: hypothetical protein ACKPE3_04455 [Sphaerospermopsis kisseleviana]
MKIEDLVRKAVQNGKSGATSIHAIHGLSETSLSWGEFKAALGELNAPISLKRDLDKGVIEPTTPEEWRWLENATNPKFRVKVNSQPAAFANANFSGVFSTGEHARTLRDWNTIRQEQAHAQAERLDAGYGKSRMGGWVEM